MLLSLEALDRFFNEVPLKQNPDDHLWSEALAGYIGAFDSSQVEPDERYRSEFGDMLDEKFVKQGIAPPKWQR